MMGTCYRGVCPNCTAYIRSGEEPDFRDSEAHSGFWEEWKAEVDAFLSSDCPHHGDGIEDTQAYAYYEERAARI